MRLSNQPGSQPCPCSDLCTATSAHLIGGDGLAPRVRHGQFCARCRPTTGRHQRFLAPGSRCVRPRGWPPCSFSRRHGFPPVRYPSKDRSRSFDWCGQPVEGKPAPAASQSHSVMLANRSQTGVRGRSHHRRSRPRYRSSILRCRRSLDSPSAAVCVTPTGPISASRPKENTLGTRGVTSCPSLSAVHRSGAPPLLLE
jgi:hypothetical protein